MDFLTQQKVNELKEELEVLETIERKKIVEEIEKALEFGDLSENAEYQAAKDKQGKIEDRILEIKQILEKSKLIKHENSEIIEIGSRVVLLNKENKNTFNFQIVGSEECDPSTGLISNHSPIAKSILGLKKGDSFSFKQGDKGTINYLIAEVN